MHEHKISVNANMPYIYHSDAYIILEEQENEN